MPHLVPRVYLEGVEALHGGPVVERQEGEGLAREGGGVGAACEGEGDGFVAAERDERMDRGVE